MQAECEEGDFKVDVEAVVGADAGVDADAEGTDACVRGVNVDSGPLPELVPEPARDAVFSERGKILFATVLSSWLPGP